MAAEGLNEIAVAPMKEAVEVDNGVGAQIARGKERIAVAAQMVEGEARIGDIGMTTAAEKGRAGFDEMTMKIASGI